MDDPQVERQSVGRLLLSGTDKKKKREDGEGGWNGKPSGW